MMVGRGSIAIGAILVLAVCPAAHAQVQPHGANDAGGFRDILPPGANGHASATDAAAFMSLGRRPAHNDDQLVMYTDLLYAAPGVRDADVRRHFRDATFGVRADDIERTYAPCPEVTVIRDRSFGIPHIYGSTRDGTFCGVGYATAEDRLFLMDALRHAGRAQLSSFAGGSPTNRAQDAQQWARSPYTEAELDRQVAELEDQGPDGQRVRRDIDAYVRGINRYVAEARLEPDKMPVEYAGIGRPAGPEDFRPSDLVAIGTLITNAFGNPGGYELAWTQVHQALRERLGARAGAAAFLDFRSPEDPEAPTTVRARRFPFRQIPRRTTPGSVAMPDRGSVRPAEPIAAAGSSGAGLAPVRLPPTASNALLVAGRKARSGRPLAVFGPQVGYFAPQLLLQLDIHGPGIDAAGMSAPGASPYIGIGRGRDYAWSMTAPHGQDLQDTYAVRLCEPDGSEPTLSSLHYLLDNECLPIERLRRVNSWTPNAVDRTAPGSETLVAERTRVGLVIARATIQGRPVAYTRLRPTYLREGQSVNVMFAAVNDPERVRGPRSFQHLAAGVDFGFNWFYVDSRHTAYFNSGANPLRPRGTNPLFPVWADRRFRWRGFDPATGRARYAPFASHPQVIDQDVTTSWNNKSARAFSAPDAHDTFTSVYRSLPLDRGLRKRLAGGRKLSLADVVDAMQDAATVDLRGAEVLPWVLRVVGAPDAPDLAGAVRKLSDWAASGAHRIDRDRDGAYEHAEAIRILDAWWPRLVRAQFEPVLGEATFEELTAVDKIDTPPNTNGQHLGSAFVGGMYGTVQKDLRALLGRRVRGRLSRVYCGRGSRERCRADLTAALAEAVKMPTEAVYPGDAYCRPGDQVCWDSIVFRAVSAITQPRIPWQNRPTYQQAVEVGAVTAAVTRRNITRRSHRSWSGTSGRWKHSGSGKPQESAAPRPDK